MEILFNYENVDFELENTEFYIHWINQTAKNENKEIGDISYVFCSDDYLLDINQRFLEHDFYTDIITFDYSEANVLSGDLMISIDRVKDNSEKLNTPFSEELKRVMIHGILHLCGYKDKTKEEELLMRSKEDFYLARFNA